MTMTNTFEHRRCEEKVISEIVSNPCVKLMFLALKKNGCPVELSRHISCEPCHGRLKGGFDSKNNQIVLCEDSSFSYSSSFGRVLTHELVHALDHCTRRVDWDDLEHLACAEVRAANLTDCSPTRALLRDFPGPLRRLKAGHRECVLDKASRSVSAIRPRDSKETVARTVENVFKSCFHYVAPFHLWNPPYGQRDCQDALDELKRGIG